MRTYTISNQKGGVAKTTTAISLAAALGDAGRRILAVDLDPQANLTMGLGVEPETVRRGMFDVMTRAVRPAEARLEAVVPGVDLLPADLTLAGCEKRLFGEIGFDEILSARLAEMPGYDAVIIDSPPSLGLLTVNALTSADVVLVPVQCEYFSARGLGQLLEITDMVRQRRRPSLRVRVLPTLYDQRNRICRDVLAELEASFGEDLFATRIGIDTRLRESAAAGQPITSFAPRSRAAKQYRALAKEVLADLGRPVGPSEGASRPSERSRPRGRRAPAARTGARS